MQAPFQIGLSSRLLRVRHLPGCRVSPELELVDLSFRIRDCGIGIRPCKADFEGRKRNAVDDDRLQIRPPNPGMPQTSSCLERLNFEAVIVALHFRGSRYFPGRRKHEPVTISVNSFTYRPIFHGLKAGTRRAGSRSETQTAINSAPRCDRRALPRRRLPRTGRRNSFWIAIAGGGNTGRARR